MIQHRLFRCTLLAEAILLIVLASLHAALPVLFPALSAFPFSQLGLLLRKLSLSGSTGNVIAILLYILLSLLPSVSLLFLKRKGPLHAEDFILALISLAMFPVLYLMVNPGDLPVPGSEGVFCFILWSLAAAWLTLRVLRSLSASDRPSLTRWFSRLLRAAAFYFVFEIFGSMLPALMEALAPMCQPESLWAAAPYSDAEVAFTVISQLVAAVPPAASILVIFRSVRLLDLLQSDDAQSVPAAKELSLLCVRSLSVSVLSVAVLNLLQLILMNQLRKIHITVVLPVLELTLVLDQAATE